jgi:hypothetical protein
MRLILIEQIYRAQQILKKHPYHKWVKQWQYFLILMEQY